MLVQSGIIYVGKHGSLRIVAYQPSPSEGVSVAYCDLCGVIAESGIIHRHGIAFDPDGGGDHRHWTNSGLYNWKIAEHDADIDYVQSLTDGDILRFMSFVGGEA